MKSLSSTLGHQDYELDPTKVIANSVEGSMTPTKTKSFMVLAVALFLVIFVVVAQFSTPIPSRIGSAVTVLTIITASAVGIERLIEIFWTYIGLTRGSWWPLGPIREQLDALLSSLDTTFEPFYQEARVIMQKLQQAETWGEEKLTAAATDLDKIKKHIDGLKKLPIDSQRVRLIIDSALRSVDYFSEKYPDIKEASGLAKLGIEGVTNFVETFKDNPGRRLISLFAGSILGLVIAGILGLDIFGVVLQTSASDQPNRVVTVLKQEIILLPHAGVAITGLLMGLGSSPTHEAIRLLQEMKKWRKTQNVG